MLLGRPPLHIAGDLVAVLAALAVQTPQLVLLVHAPPALDSVALCRTLRAASRVPIILLVTTPGGAGRVCALRAGADDALPNLSVLHERLALQPSIGWDTLIKGCAARPIMTTQMCWIRSA